MAHTYASLIEFNEAIRTGGSTTFASEAAAIVARKLATLESVSRRIDQFTERSPRFGSGFGPRTGTNRYDGDGGHVLRLEDDLLAVTGLTVLDGTAQATYKSPAATTDYYPDPYDSTPYRQLILHGQGTVTAWTYGIRTVSVVGSWGYEDVRVVATATTNEALDTSETGVDVSSATEFSPGQTLLVDSEQMYVRSISGSTLTVVRGANGTTAATHLTAAAISIYQYPTVNDLCLRIAVRRWRQPDAAADEGSALPSMVAREGEDLMLRRSIGHLSLRTPG